MVTMGDVTHDDPHTDAVAAHMLDDASSSSDLTLPNIPSKSLLDEMSQPMSPQPQGLSDAQLQILAQNMALEVVLPHQTQMIMTSVFAGAAFDCREQQPRCTTN